MPSKKRLNQADVVAAAAGILNAEGADSLTLNRLAAELGIQPPSLYNHIDGMPGLQKELSVLNAKLLADQLGEAAIGKGGSDIPVDRALFGDVNGDGYLNPGIRIDPSADFGATGYRDSVNELPEAQIFSGVFLERTGNGKGNLDQ